MDIGKAFDKKKYWKEVNIADTNLQNKFDVMTANYLLHSQVLVLKYQCLHPKIDGSVSLGDIRWSKYISLQDKLR